MSKQLSPSSYLKFLPAIYQSETNDFLGRFLKAFETILSGSEETVVIDGVAIKGLMEILDEFSNLFNPLKTNAEFLPWLAGWVALNLKDDWNTERNRKLISQIVKLYQKRGTKEGLEEYLKIYVNEDVHIYENPEPFQIGVVSRIGEDTVIGKENLIILKCILIFRHRAWKYSTVKDRL